MRHSYAAVEDSARDNDEALKARETTPLAKGRVLDGARRAAQSFDQQARRRALGTT